METFSEQLDKKQHTVVFCQYKVTHLINLELGCKRQTTVLNRADQMVRR